MHGLAIQHKSKAVHKNMKPALRLDFPSIQTRLTDDEIDRLALAIRDADVLSMGPYLRKFEQQFAEYLGVKHAFGVSNASCALELAAMISGVGEGDEVILPAHTFTATALPFMRLKAKLVFADIDPHTFVMDVEDVRKKMTSKTKVIVPVHLYGLPVRMDALMELARENRLTVIEDCAQSPGAVFQGKKTGTFGEFGCFSFHGQKNITTLGEGGMIVTNSDESAEKILGLRKIGQRPFVNQEKYWLPAMTNVVEALPGRLPYNFALGEIQAFAGTLLLERLDAINAIRRLHARKIVSALSEHTQLSFQRIPDDCRSAVHLLPARFEETGGATRDDLIELLYDEYGIKCVIQYCPLYRYELFRNNGYFDDGSCPETNRFFDSMISFPFGSDLDDHDIEYLINSINTALHFAA
jgi:perosamine synthetase